MEGSEAASPEARLVSGLSPGGRRASSVAFGAGERRIIEGASPDAARQSPALAGGRRPSHVGPGGDDPTNREAVPESRRVQLPEVERRPSQRPPNRLARWDWTPPVTDPQTGPDTVCPHCLEPVRPGGAVSDLIRCTHRWRIHADCQLPEGAACPLCRPEIRAMGDTGRSVGLKLG
jgi:hypothetical protein